MTHYAPTAFKRSSDGDAQPITPDARDVRALTQYLTVLEDIGRVRGADDLYLVVSESGSEYLVDAREERCECPDHEYRRVRCKHIRRVAFATGVEAVPADVEDVDPDLGAHVDGEVHRATTDGGQTAPYTVHREDPEQGGAKYVRCRECGVELVVDAGGWENLVHRDGCSHAGESGW